MEARRKATIEKMRRMEAKRLEDEKINLGKGEDKLDTAALRKGNHRFELTVKLRKTDPKDRPAWCQDDDSAA